MRAEKSENDSRPYQDRCRFANFSVINYAIPHFLPPATLSRARVSIANNQWEKCGTEEIKFLVNSIRF